MRRDELFENLSLVGKNLRKPTHFMRRIIYFISEVEKPMSFVVAFAETRGLTATRELDGYRNFRDEINDSPNFMHK